MKTIQTFLVAFVLMMTATTAHAQVRFGLKGGVNLTNFSFNNGLDNVLDASNRTGFYIGPTLFVKVPLVGLGVDGSVLYDQREAKISVIALVWVVRPAYSSLPVLSSDLMSVERISKNLLKKRAGSLRTVSLA